MGEPITYQFSFKEVVEALIKQQKLHEGLWEIHFEFGIKGANVGSTDDNLYPTALIPIVKMGLHKAEKENNLSVNAAEVNPAPH